MQQRNQNSNHNGRRGFTLLEMMVASTIMAIAIVGLLSTISGATRNAARLRDYDRVVQLSRLRMNDLLADINFRPGQSPSGAFDPHLTGGIQVTWQSRISTVVTSPQRMVGQPSLERIELRVAWTTGQQQRSLTLDAYRTRYLGPGDL